MNTIAMALMVNTRTMISLVEFDRQTDAVIFLRAEKHFVLWVQAIIFFGEFMNKLTPWGDSNLTILPVNIINEKSNFKSRELSGFTLIPVP